MEALRTEAPAAIAVTANSIAEKPGDAVPAPSTSAIYVRNAFITGVRLLVFAAIGVLLPSFLTHHLSIAVYGAWILILQLASYVSYLDLGAQTGVSKYIAQYTALGDQEACDSHAKAGVAITLSGCVIGIGVSIGLAHLVPVFFREMPVVLLKDVSRGVLLVGISTAILLATSAIGGVFLGLQRYSVPVLLSIANKTIYASLLVVMVLQHRSLTVMGAGVATANIITAVAQVVAWRRLIPQIHLWPHPLVWPIVKRMLVYCGVLGIWTTGMILISGLDTTIVGHYRFTETAFYAVAAVPILFLNQLLMAALGPLMPATSALSVTRTPEQLGALLERVTRYTMLIMLSAGLPLALFGYPLLSIWVGPEYARHSLLLMRILLVANVIRNTCLPYCGMVLATGMQRFATLSGVCEALVNLTASILLGRAFGAIGVAGGTLIGSIVGVLFHFLVSMRKTQSAFAVPASTVMLRGVLLPNLAAVPALCLLPLFWKPASVPMLVPIACGWAALTLAILWLVGLTGVERYAIATRLPGKTFRRL